MHAKTRFWIVLATVMMLLTCSQDRKKDSKRRGDPAPAEPAAAEPVSKIRQLSPGNFTGAVWKNGVHNETKEQFFLVVAKDAPLPVRVGDRLRFASTGEALVVNVHLQEKENHRLVFVRVDRKLDPAGDGYPAIVEVLGHELRASAFSDGKNWQNGILLKNNRVFLLVLGEGDPVPFQVGGRLRFHGAGRAIVKSINQRDLPGGGRQVFVEVDRSLDPESDGFPQLIQIVAGNS